MTYIFYLSVHTHLIYYEFKTILLTIGYDGMRRKCKNENKELFYICTAVTVYINKAK